MRLGFLGHPDRLSFGGKIFCKYASFKLVILNRYLFFHSSPIVSSVTEVFLNFSRCDVIIIVVAMVLARLT